MNTCSVENFFLVWKTSLIGARLFGYIAKTSQVLFTSFPLTTIAENFKIGIQEETNELIATIYKIKQ